MSFNNYVFLFGIYLVSKWITNKSQKNIYVLLNWYFLNKFINLGIKFIFMRDGNRKLLKI